MSNFAPTISLIAPRFSPEDLMVIAAGGAWSGNLNEPVARSCNRRCLLRRECALRASRRYAARQPGALLQGVGRTVWLDRLLLRHQRRLWLGALELERSSGWRGLWK